jgi:hypothetical protein
MHFCNPEFIQGSSTPVTLFAHRFDTRDGSKAHV